jgi:selenoprotein W-related protein
LATFLVANNNSNRLRIVELLPYGYLDYLVMRGIRTAVLNPYSTTGLIKIKTCCKPESKPMPSPRLAITYCTQCRWLLRAAWMAQELLTTFTTELGEVALVPGTGGIFEVRLEEELIFSRKEQGRFPESKELKQLVRDRIAPARDLGHSDRPKDPS